MFIIFTLARVIFPSQFFTYSFANINSLKNTIMNMAQADDKMNFYASTPLNFSQIEINLELASPVADFKNQKITLQKSYKAFFYPEASSLDDLKNKEENSLVSIDDSVFIVGNQKTTPIDSTLTFESLGYSWDSLRPNTTDLSAYEKQKLADLNAAHPTGTILKTTSGSTYYFIENFTKKKIVNPSPNNIQNAIAVDEESLNKSDFCILEKNKLFPKKYSCEVPLSQIVGLIGKDYRFTLDGLPANIQIKKIGLKFEKSLTRENFQFFLGELKKRMLYRFGFKDA